MGFKIEHECDFCERRAKVDLPKSGPLDLGKIGLPKDWEEVESFPGGNVGPTDGLQLCDECKLEYSPTLEQAEKARDEVFRQAMVRAKSLRGPGKVSGKTAQSSSFQRA